MPPGVTPSQNFISLYMFFKSVFFFLDLHDLAIILPKKLIIPKYQFTMQCYISPTTEHEFWEAIKMKQIA